MADLRIVLKGGFRDEPVTVWLDGDTVLSLPHARTRMQIARAGAADVPAAPGRRGVRVALPAREWEGERSLDLVERATVEVYADGDSPRIEVIDGELLTDE